EAAVGEAEYEDSLGEFSLPLDSMTANWTYNPEDVPGLTNNHWDMRRRAAAMEMTVVDEESLGKHVMEVTLVAPPEEAPMLGNYGTFEPSEPILIPGDAEAIGLQVKGSSQWHRIIFELEDAKG